MADLLTEANLNEKSKREIEWEEVENLVMVYQERFTDDSEKVAQNSQAAAAELIERFQPLFNKYLKIIKRSDINLFDPETKSFVFSFIDKQTRILFPSNKKEIAYKFKFVVKTYGMLSDNEILSDQYEIFMKLLKRYKQMGRSFCGYLYNVFFHEMSRLIKKFIANPINIAYKLSSYSECKEFSDPYELIEDLLIDYYDKKEVLYLEWVNGIDCEPVFESLTITDRKILMEYYINEQNDKQISENFGIHINTVNQKRRKALFKLLSAMPDNHNLEIVRSRKTGSFSVPI